MIHWHFCIVNTPSFFEKMFLPFVSKVDVNSLRDPLDQCMSSTLNEVKLLLKNYEVDIIHDYEHHPTRRPKILVQTAGHVSAGAYYYQPSDEDKKRWPNTKLYGVSAHHKYGGWFAFRGAIIFKSNEVTCLERKEAKDFLTSHERIDLLEAFNFHWEDWSYRDVSAPREKYSEIAKAVF